MKKMLSVALMAIMPAHGQGQHSINPEQAAGTTVYTVDFSDATYEWDLMLDDYTDTEAYTDEQARAVAQLCYHVGVAANMGYMADASNTDNQYAIDGYNAEGLVHVNWGWSGRHNGYYDIALLNPSDLHFDAFQMMVIGIRPPTPPEQDALSTVRTAPAGTTVYTLDGRPVSLAPGQSLPPGIYVRQGRKFVVR